MDRRKFNTSLLAAAAAYNLSSIEMPEVKRQILPERLHVGDVVGLVAPAGMMTEEKINHAVAKIESYGFRVKKGKYLDAQYGYLAGTDQQRIEDLHAMYRDDRVKGIWCARGGYGITRILDLIDYRLIRRNPKILIGFSDITALLNAIFQQTGIIGFHGPLGASDDNAYTREILRDLIMHPEKSVEIPLYLSKDEAYEPMQTFIQGEAKGIAVGGNLSLMAALAGTRYEIKCKNRIVFMEDVGEEPYRIDRMLTQLIHATDIGKAKGIVLGQFKGCHPSNPERSLSLLECLKDKLLPLEIPLVYGLNFGHVAHHFTFPIGGEVHVNFNSGIVKIIEQMVG
ncbi:S66 peptidase family protein [Portibacter marinus]|uniref:S66 peptidase family protein n=1 Tax=Portibacter marinus TaxID=2898660 RepID=UPI001F29912F|nr:LD-carboxypeptidase [Portibacter marinus]